VQVDFVGFRAWKKNRPDPLGLSLPPDFLLSIDGVGANETSWRFPKGKRTRKPCVPERRRGQGKSWSDDQKRERVVVRQGGAVAKGILGGLVGGETL